MNRINIKDASGELICCYHYETKTEKKSIKDFSNNLWSCRDLEIKNLWQRSVFLTAFIILCWTGYGASIMKLVDIIGKSYPLNITTEFSLVNTICLAISIIGYLFGILWIMMSKSSKAWYELYERLIEKFENNPDHVENEIQEFSGFKHHNLLNDTYLDFDHCIFSTQGGCYSPSRINIAIGQIMVTIWTLLILTHIFIIIYPWHKSNCISPIDVIIIFVTVFIIIISTLGLTLSSYLKSSTLNDFIKK